MRTRNLIVILISLVFLLGLGACDNDDDPPEPIIPLKASDLYNDFIGLKDIPCGDVPYFGPTASFLGEYFKDSFIYYFNVNPLNKAYIGFGVLRIHNSFTPIELSVFYHNLETKETIFAGIGDMSSSNIVLGGSYMAFSNGFNTRLFDSRDNSTKEYPGNEPSLSPDGKWLKIDVWDGSYYTEKLIDIETGDTDYSWSEREKDNLPGFVLWRNNSSSFIYRQYEDGELFIKQFNVETFEATTLMKLEYGFNGYPSTWLSDDKFVSTGGNVCDLVAKSYHNVQENCTSDKIKLVVKNPFSPNLIIRKPLLDVDSTAQVVTVYEQFFLSDEFGEEQKPITFKFDKN